MNVIFDPSGLPLYSVNGTFAVPEGCTVRKLPEKMQGYPLHYLKLESGEIVVNLPDNGYVMQDDKVVLRVEAAREKVWTAIKAMRTTKREGGFKVQVGESWFHSDPESVSNYLALQTLGSGMLPREWKTMDGTVILMNYAVLMLVISALTEHQAKCFTAAEEHKTAMLKAADPLAYDYSKNWPDTYQ